MSRIALSVGVVFVLGAVAQAGVIEWHAAWLDNSPLNLPTTGWSWNWGTETWTVWEDYVAPIIDESASTCWGVADVDPNIHVEKTITNNSSFAWTDYHMEVTGSAGVTYVPGSATSDVFGTIIETPITGGWAIDFYAPLTVPIGTDVTIDLDITIPVGGFSFDISQMPTPEPTTLSLLLLGGLALFRRR